MDTSISPQYITKSKIIVTILDVVNPAHFVVKESPDLLNASSEAKNFLEAEDAMQKYYASVQPCFFQLPLKDAIIVVLHKEKFYRARVLNILTLSAGHLFRVYLVDYGIECSIPRDCIYEIERDFLKHPFQAVDVKLLGIEPVSMIMNSVDLSMTYGPVSDWDPSAEIYLQDLQKKMCSAYIEVQGMKGHDIYGRVYLCYDNIPEKCVNDELVSNSFARFNKNSWNNIQKIDTILDGCLVSNTEITEAKNSNIPNKANSEEVPSTNSNPQSELDFANFKMMFLNPTDGKIVAQSTLTTDTAVVQLPTEGELESQVAVEPQPSEGQKVAVERQPSDMTTGEQKALSVAERRFQKLRKLTQKKHQSSNESSDIQNVGVKTFCKNVCENQIELRNSAVDCSSIKDLKSSDSVISRTTNIKPSQSSIKSSEVNIEACAGDNLKQENISQVSSFALRRFRKLQELNRKKSCHATESDIVHEASVTNLLESSESLIFNKNASEKSLSNRQLSSPVDQNDCNHNINPSSHQNKTDSEISAVDIKLNNSYNSSNLQNMKIDERKGAENPVSLSESKASCTNETSSVPHCALSVPNISTTKNDSMTENMTQAQLIAQKRLMKLQQLNRKKFQSPIQETVITSSITKTHVSPCEKSVTIDRERKCSSAPSDVIQPASECSSNSIAYSDHSKNVSSSPKSSEERINIDENPAIQQTGEKSSNLEKVETFTSKFKNFFSVFDASKSKVQCNEKNDDIITKCDHKNTSSILSPVNQKYESNSVSTIDEASSIIARKNLQLASSAKPSDFSVSSDSIASSPDHSAGQKMGKQLLNTSDSDDLLCEISTKKEKVPDKLDIGENFIKLSTQLEDSDVKTMAFDSMSLLEKQKVPVLQIGTEIPAPVKSIEETNFSDNLKRVLKTLKFPGPSCIQSVVWPSIEQGRSVIVIAPPHSGKTLSYLLPLVSYFTTKGACLPTGNGPYAIVLCSSWIKAQAVIDYFHLFLPNKKVRIVTIFTDVRNFSNKIVHLVNRCDILVATPFCLLQLLKKNFVHLSHLNQFIIDDGSTVMSKFKKELKNIILCLMDSAKKNQDFPQMVLCAKRWDKNFQIMQNKVMVNPLVYFTSFLESAVYAKVPIFSHVCEATEKKSALLDVVKEAGKIVICTTNGQDALDIHHFLRCEDVRTFLVNEEMVQYVVNEVVKDWKSVRCTATSSCLIVTDPVLPQVCINNADCLVHYDVPSESRLQFGNRFLYIAEHFLRVDDTPRCTCHILVDKSTYPFAPQIVEIIRNSGGTPSDKLMEMCKKQDKDQSTSSLLCHYIKAFGICEKPSCRHRHYIDAEEDKPRIVPCEGDVQALVTHVIDASHFYMRLLKYLDPEMNKTVSFTTKYVQIGFELRDFYKNNPEELIVKSPIVGKIYVLEEESKLFYRIKVLKIYPASSTQLSKWEILFLDEGWVKCLSEMKLYELTDKINFPDPLAVEVYACNFSTLDLSWDWNPQTIRLVKELIGEKEIHGKIALCLGETLWLDPIVLRMQLSSPSEYVNLLKLDQKLLDCGHIKMNRSHLVKLKQACEGKVSLPRIIKPMIKKEIEPKSEPSVNYAFLDCDTCEDVYVSSAISPHQLYVQRAKFVECLDELIDKINVQVEKRKLKKANTLYKGMHCIAPFVDDNKYYRAVVTDMVSYDEVQLFYVDFGDSRTASRNSIYCASAEFLLLPFQAIECELVGIAAAHGGWTDSAANFLITLTRDEVGDMKMLRSKVYSKTKCYEGGNHYVIDLWHDERNVTEQLLQAGYGVPVDKWTVSSTKMTSSEVHNSNSEVFDFNTKPVISSDEGTDPEDKDTSALFYEVVAQMISGDCDSFSKEVTSDDIEIVKELKKFSFSTSSEMPAKSEKSFLTQNQNPHCIPSSVNSTDSLKPLITWWDTSEELNILINLKNVKIYQLDVTDEGLTFHTFISGNKYSAEEKFYDKIQSQNTKQYQNAHGINIQTRKHTAFKWPRLTKDKRKFLHIKYDLIHIEDSDTEEQPKVTKLKPPRPEYLIENDSGSTDEEEKYVEPWREFAEINDPY